MWIVAGTKYAVSMFTKIYFLSQSNIYTECIRTVVFLMTATRTTAVSPCAVAAVVVVAVAVVILYPLLLLLSVERRVRH